MSYQELLETLISDGHQKLTLYSGRLHTDDGSTEVHFMRSPLTGVCSNGRRTWGDLRTPGLTVRLPSPAVPATVCTLSGGPWHG